MAKETKNQQAVAITADNVMDQVRGGNLMTQVITKQVQDEIQKEKDERKAAALKTRILKASYQRILKLIQLRNKRRINDITLDTLKKSELLEDRLAGFVLTEEKIKKHGGKGDTLEIEVLDAEGKKVKQTFKLEKGKEVWVPGSITCEEYDTESQELVADERKKIAESDRQLDKETRELQAQYPGYFSYSWNW